MASRFFSLFFLLHLAAAFTHPGLLVTDTDITRAKTKIAAKADPWYSSWTKLTSITYAKASYTANAGSVIARSTNGSRLWHDAAAAFDLALRWKISGDEEYANASANVLTAWADTLVKLSGGGDDDYLTAGLQGYELANAAELLRNYTPFAQSGLAKVSNMMQTVFLPMNKAFINHELSSEHNVIHFFANWELCNLASIMAIGVLTDNQTTWDFAINYLHNGNGNGALNKAISYIVEEPDTGNSLGQGQEEGRDQGHSAMDYQLLGVIGQQAWNQGEDIFSYNDSRILLGAEYFARYNLGYDVPFKNYTNGIVSYSQISNSSRGATRPTWELLYAHYVQVKGVSAPWTTKYLNKTLVSYGGYELGAGALGEGSGNYDGLGWGSLLYHLDASDVTSNTSTTASSKAATSATKSTAVSSSRSSSISSASFTSIRSTTATSAATSSVKAAAVAEAAAVTTSNESQKTTSTVESCSTQHTRYYTEWV